MHIAEMAPAALAAAPGWMGDAWLVATRLGCRLRQAGTLMRDVDERSGTIRLLEQKKKRHVAPIHPDLMPLIERRRAEGATRLVEMPAVQGSKWRRFFNKLGMPHVSFHCTRVTVVTQLARAGVTQQQAQAYVGHASSTVHAVYQKLQARDVAHVGRLLG